MKWIEEANREEKSHNEILSFADYMKLFEENPLQECRSSSQYLLDMINHFGQTEDGHYKVFQTDYADSRPVYGQRDVQHEFVHNLKNFLEEGLNNKFILLVGPNGSAKSSLVRKLMKGSEEYSKEDKGRLYTFSWIFPIDNFVKGTLGLTHRPSSEGGLNTYANLDDKDITAILTSELKDHPLLLIPCKYRQEILEDALKDDPEHLEAIRKSYLYAGDLSKRNNMIYDALLKNYKGSHEEVLKHIRIERFRISRRYSSSAVTIEPQLHVDAKLQQITMDKRLASLPPSLQSLNLFSMQGEAVSANRGILEFSDLLKRPLDTYKYLLMTMETGNINLQGILTQLDIFFVGTSNEIHLAAFKQHPDFNSFKGRINFIRVPYLLDYKEEEKIYANQVDGLKELTSFEPHALSSLCLFAVMTRIRSCLSKNYENKKLGNIVTGLNPLEKSFLLADGVTPKRLDSESKQHLIQNRDKIRDEYLRDNLYEGKFGISPRDIKNIIYDLANEYKNLTFLEIIESLEEVILRKNEYDFLNMTQHGDYHHPTRFIQLVKDHYLNIFDQELRDSLGMIDSRSYEDYIKKYVENINAIIKGEKIKNNITGKFENVDDYFIKEFESNIDLKETPEEFRSHLISKLGAYYLDNRNQEINYSKVFPDLTARLKQSFRVEQKKVIDSISKNIVYFEAEVTGEEGVKTPLSEEGRKQITTVIDNLKEKYSYSEKGALSLMKHTIKERY